MKQETSNKKHLTPRQIINRYRKGEYVDESIEAISSTISQCNESFDSITIPFPTSIIEKVYENIGLARTLYELRSEGKSIEDIKIPNYTQLEEILIDLSNPVLWKSMLHKDNVSIEFMEIIKEQGLNGKYRLDVKAESTTNVTSYLSHTYRKQIESTGLDFTSLQLAISMMIK